MENVTEHYLLVIKFYIKNVLCNFYVKRTVKEKSRKVYK